MKKIQALLTKELGSYFISPVAYVVIFIFLAVSGFLFFQILYFFNLQSIQWMRSPGLLDRINLNDMVLFPFFHNMVVFFTFLIPVLTMRLLSEEKKLGTGELLFTSPITTTEVVLGKFFSATSVILVMLLFSFVYPLMIIIFGNPDVGPIFTAYLGLFLLGSAAAGLGILTSSMTENQIIAVISAWGILILLLIIGWAAQSVGPTFGAVLQHLSILEHFQNFSKGIIELKDVVYYLSFIFFTLFLTQRVLDSQSWR